MMPVDALFPRVAVVVLSLWGMAVLGYALPLRRERLRLGTMALVLGWAILAGFLAVLWGKMGRPPMRTLGETRLWVCLFLPAIGLLCEYRWRYRVLAACSAGLSAVMAGIALVRGQEAQGARAAHRLVHIGFPFLTAGLIFGACWAQDAWGHYWRWDPKETWAFLTWAFYLVYLHARMRTRLLPRVTLVLLLVGFTVALGCWFGVNALPTAAQSVHTYSSE